MSPNSSKKRNAKPKTGPPRWIYYGGIAIIFLLAAFLRFWYLDRIPTGMVADELDYVLNAKAIYHTGGSIITQAWSPWSLTTVPTEVPKAEFPYLISVPFVGPFGLSIFTARVGYAIASLIYVGVIIGLASSLFGPWVGLASGLAAAINPWSVYYGRTAYDVPIAITAYIAALWIIVRLRGPKILLAILPLFIAFYSYIGTKVLFVPFIAISLIGSWLLIHKRKNTLWLTLVGVFSIALFSIFLLQLHSLDANQRVNQLFTPWDAKIAANVDIQRRLTLASPLTSLFANKLVVYAKEAIIKFFGAFSPSILFTNGEGIATFSLWEHGLFYPLDAVFLLLGIGALFTVSPAILFFLLGIVGIATLPSVLSTAGTTYVHRSSLMYPIFTIFIGYGLVASIQWIKPRWRLVSGLGIFALYMLLVANFTYLYFFRFPYYNSESFGLSQRVYSRYSVLSNAHGIPVDHITGSAVGYYRIYLFYANIPNTQTIPTIRNAFATNTYAWGNTTFTKVCPTKENILDGKTTYVLSDTSPCKPLFIKQPMLSIPSLSDGGMLYMIFNDRLCSKYALSSYPTGFSMADFDIEHLSEKRFCERFIIRYSQPLYLPQPEK